MEALEDRRLLAFSVIESEIYSTGGFRLVADFNQPVNAATVQAADLVLDDSTTASGFNIVDADTVEFLLPSLAAGTHSATIAIGAIQDSQGTSVDLFSKSFAVASSAQYTVKHNPRLQPGNAPLVGYAGGELDRVDVLWQTISGGTGTQDSFTIEYRPSSSATWQSSTLNPTVNTGVEGRVIWSTSITGLDWNSDYEYRIRHRRADVIAGQYQNTFRTRLAAGDSSSFSFAAYGDSASGSASGFRQVQSRINQINPNFSVLLGDNVYAAGTHQESDARFDPVVNPEAAAWMAGHIDYLGLGNHDVATLSGLPSEQNFSVPIPVAGVTAPAAPPATERAEHSFSWDYGDVHFVTFDTNSYSDATRLDGLLNWVVTDLAASTARWKVVYGHHPLAGVPDKPENPSGNYYQQVVNRLKAAGVDLFMTGHSHTYSWTYPLTGQINGAATYENHGVDDHFHAGEGLPQLVSGVGGVGIRTGDYSQFPFVASGFTSTTAVPARFGFSKVDVTSNTLTVSYVAADDGAVIDSFVIEKETTQATSFQQGVNGYTGTVDTFLHQNAPTTSNATAVSLKVDNDDPASTGLDAQTLLRFDNLFGSGAGQIPANVTLRSATLQLNVTNGSTNNMNLHRMLTSWSAADTWDSRTNGIQTDGVEAVASPDTSSGSSQVGTLSFNVLASLRAWQSNPATNLGWAFVPTGTDGIDFNSSEGSVKPKLIVTWVESGPNVPPTANADSATTNENTPLTISVLANDTDPNGDLLTVQSTTAPAHGSVVVNANQSVTYTPANGYYGPDTFSYTASDGRGGTSSATVSLTIVQVSGTQTVVFQQGLNGYASAVDTFIQQNTPGANNGAATSLNVDSDDPVGSGLDVQTLLRFDNLFGSVAGKIPTNATLQSATLQLQVTNSGNAINLHRMLAPWSASDTWSSLTGGVANDGIEAIAAADVSTGAIPTGLLSLNVLTSLQAWRANPASNRGWVLLPTGSDGVDFDSSEGSTRPKLTVVYIPASNNPPTAINDTATTNEDTPTTISVLANDSDSDGGTLTVTAVTSGSLGTTAIGSGGTVTYTPNANVSGSDSFTYTISDGQGGSATASVAVTVNPVNDAPVASNDTGNTTGTTPVTISVLSNDTDIENSPLTAVLASSPANGTAIVNANGVVTYTANGGFAGTDSFTYRANDGALNSNLATVTVTVAAAPKFFVVDSAADKTFRYAANGGYLSQAVLAAGNTNSRGVAANTDGTQFWVLDNNKVVYVYDANQTLLGSWTVSGLKTPTGIAVSGNDVWISDSGNDRVHRHAGGASRLRGTFAATSSFALASANNNPQDLATDGSTIWVTQSGATDRVYVYSAIGTSLGNWTLPAANTSPVGITIDPTGASQSLWVVDDSTDRVYEYADARSWQSGTKSAAVTFALNASNGSAQGIADPRALTARDAVFASQAFTATTSVSLTTAFQSLRSTAIWPVSGTTFNQIESTFGPRIKASTSGYDWHRGIDIDAPEGAPVLAPMAGTLFDIKTYTDGGLTVILKHTFPEPVLFAGKSLTSYYTYYMHLSSVDPTLQAAADAGQTPAVSQGFPIGRVGHSGTALGDHLHWEIRIGTPYSLEWQRANPTSQYGANNFGFDPHVHPLLLTVPTSMNTLAASALTKPTNKIDGRVRITTDDEQPIFNRVQVKIVKKSTNLTVADHTLDLNERLGFNATTNALLDTPDLTKPYFAPISFGTSSSVWSTDLLIPKSWVGANFGSKFQTTVTLTDIWGRTTTITW